MKRVWKLVPTIDQGGTSGGFTLNVVQEGKAEYAGWVPSEELGNELVHAANCHNELVAKLSAVQQILNSLVIGTQTTALGRDRSLASRNEANCLIDSALKRARGE